MFDNLEVEKGWKRRVVPMEKKTKNLKKYWCPWIKDTSKVDGNVICKKFLRLFQRIRNKNIYDDYVLVLLILTSYVLFVYLGIYIIRYGYVIHKISKI